MAAANASLGDLRTWTHHLFPPTLEEKCKVLPWKWRHQIPSNRPCPPTKLHGITLLILVLRFYTPLKCVSQTHYANYRKALSAKFCYSETKATENSSVTWRLWSCTTSVCLWFSAVTLQVTWTNQNTHRKGVDCMSFACGKRHAIAFRLHETKLSAFFKGRMLVICKIKWSLVQQRGQRFSSLSIW